MMDDQYGFDINLDFLDSTTSNIKPNVKNFQHEQEQPDFDIESLATRIASVNELALQLKATKREHVKLQKQMQDLSDSAMSIRCMYEREKIEKAKYALLSKELKEKCDLAESQLTNKTLHFEQLTSQFEQSAPKGPISYNELALRYQRLALQLDEDKQLNSKEKILLQQIQVYMEYKKLTALPAFKKRCNVKAETEGTCANVLPIKKETRNQGTQYTKYTTTRGTSPPAKSPQKEKRTQGTQYISSTTTRGTSTSTFIKQHTIGTNFPEVVPVSIEDIFKEMICTVSPLSPMSPSSPPVMETKSPLMKKVEMKSVSTITGLKNVRKQIDYVPVNIKYSDSRPPSRNMNDRIKSEWPFMGMPTMNPFSGLGMSPPPMHSTVAELWSMLGHTIFALLQNGNSQLNSMHANVVNDRLRNISADMNRRRDQPRANDERMREGNNYFGEDRDYVPSTKNTGTSPLMNMGSTQDFRFDETFMNPAPASPAFVAVNSNQEKDNVPVEIQKILLNKNVQTNGGQSEKKSSRVDDILQLFPQNTHSSENRKAIKRLLKASKQERKDKKKSYIVSEDGENSPVSIQTNWDLFGTSGEELNHNGSSATSPFQSPNNRTLSPNLGSSSGGLSTNRKMSYEPPENDDFLGFDEDSDNLFCKPFLPPKRSRVPLSTNRKELRERPTNQQTPVMEVENARSSLSPIPLRENASKAKRKRRASKSVTERANKLLKANVSGSVTDVVLPSDVKSRETASIFDLQFKRSSSFSRIAAPLRKQPGSTNFNHITPQSPHKSEQTPEIYSPLLNEFAAQTEDKPRSDQYPSNCSRTAMLGKRKPSSVTCREPVRQKNSNFLQFVKSDSQSSRDVMPPNSSVNNGLLLSSSVLSSPATPAPSQKKSPHSETQSEGPVAVLSRVVCSESQAQSEKTSHLKEPKSDGEDSVYISKSPSWETESNSCESTVYSEENTLNLATSRDCSLSLRVQNTLNSHRLLAEDNQLIFNGSKLPEQEKPATPVLSNQMPTNSHTSTVSEVRTQYWDSEEETSNSSFNDHLDETPGQDKDKIKFNEIEPLEEEDKKMIFLLDQMSNSYEPQTPGWDTGDSDKAENPTLAVKISDQTQNESPVSINKFNGSMTSKEEKPVTTRHPDDDTFDLQELNTGLSSSDSSADLSIDCPLSPQPDDASSLDLSLLLKTPEKENPPLQFKTPPESGNRNTSLLNKVLTSSTENLVEEFLNENSIRDEPKFQMFLSKIMGEVAPPLSPISVLAPSETPLNSETESSCDESKPPRRSKANLPATAAMAVKRSARLKAKVGTYTGGTLPLLNIPGIELGKYTKRRSEVRTPLKIPKVEFKKEKPENKVDIIGNIRLGFFKDLMVEHESSTEAMVIGNVSKEADQPTGQLFNSGTYSAEVLEPVICAPVLNQNVDICQRLQPAYDSSTDVDSKRETIGQQTSEEVIVGIPGTNEGRPKLYSHEDLPSTSRTAQSTEHHGTLFVGQILEKTKEGTWQPKTFDPICFDECPASPPPQDQTPEKSHVTRQCAESAPLLGRPTSNLSVISHIIASYDPSYHKLIKPDHQPKILNELQSVIIDFTKGLCLIMDTVRTVDTLLRLTTSEKLIATALVFVAKTAPRPETEMPSPVPDHYISHALNKLLCLIEQLHHQLPGLRRSIQATIEQSLFSFAKEIIPLEVLMNLTQFYLATIAEPTATSNPARLFICKCLYFYNQKATPMIYQTLCVYPSVLPKRDDATYDRSDALISAIQCLLMSTFYDMEKTDLKTKQMLTKLRKFYNYESFKPPRDEFLDNLIAKIRAGRFKNVSYAFALICKRMDQRNAEKVVLGERLLPLANEYYQALGQTRDNDLKIGCILECISFVIKPFTVETDISPYVNLFGRFLNASDRQIIQEAALAALLRTIRFGYVNCFNAIYNFKPNYELADETKAMLRSFVYKKTLLFLKRLEHQARMLGST